MSELTPERRRQYQRAPPPAAKACEVCMVRMCMYLHTYIYTYNTVPSVYYSSF